MLNIAICDDNYEMLNKLKKYISDYFHKQHIKDINIQLFSSGEAVLEYDGIFDLAFLDVEMSGLSGTHTGDMLKKKNPKLIFFIITSHPQYLDEAFQFHAFRYLSKPVDKNRLYNNLKAAMHEYFNRHRTIAVETKHEIITVCTNDIIMIESVKRKTTVYTTGEILECIQPISYWLDVTHSLPFYQTHKSFIVNFAHVKRFTEDLVFMSNDRKAYLTRRKHNEFKKNFMMYLNTTF